MAAHICFTNDIKIVEKLVRVLINIARNSLTIECFIKILINVQN